MGNSLTKSAVVDVAIQLVGWALASRLETEQFFDIFGSSTFLIIVVQSMIDNGTFFPRQMVQSGMVSVWAVRLGLFLLFRALKAGKDSRFDKVRSNPKMFLIFWSLQGICMCVCVKYIYTFLYLHVHVGAHVQNEKFANRHHVI